MTFTITAGRQAPARVEIPSAFRLIPGPEEDVMARVHMAAAP